MISTIKIQKVKVSQAEDYIKIRTITDGESDGMIWGKNERPALNIEKQKQMISEILKSKNEVVFLAYDGKEVIGYILAVGQQAKRVLHNRTVALAVLKKYWGKGVGTQLMKKVVNWAKKNRIHRLSLGVWATNPKAKRLYEKFGFKEEGLEKDAGLINGKYVDKYIMGNIL